MRYRITAPAEGHTGIVAGVAFHDGMAEMDSRDAAALAYFRRRGYGIEATEDADTGATERPPQAAPKDAWVTYAVAQGADQTEAEGMTKADLISTYGGA